MLVIGEIIKTPIQCLFSTKIDQVPEVSSRNSFTANIDNNTIQSESSYMSKLEAGRSPLPEPLPNFCSKDGFHIPN